jgi:hypothetical protein
MSCEELIILCRILIDLLDKGFIQASNSPASILVLFVKKPGKSLCFYIDYRALNEIIRKDRYLLFLISETLMALMKAKWLTKLNVITVFNKI